jgi:hypothetical protein
MIFGLFVFMGFWWWLFTAAAVIALIAMAEDDMWGPGIGVVVAWCLLLTLFGDMPLLGWLGALTFMAGLKWFGIYMGTGLGWSYFKWVTKLRKYKRQYNEAKAKWEAMPDKDDGHGFRGKTKEGWDSFESYMKNKMSYSTTSGVQWKKDEIIYWICFWPFSLLHFCLKDLMRFIVEDILKGTYMRIRKAVLGEALKYVED